MRKKLLPLAAAFFLPFLAGAQEARPVIRFSPLYTEGINIEETRFIESLLQIYLADAGEVVNFFDDTPPPPLFSDDEIFSDSALPDTWTRAPDYVITGSIYLERGNRIFTLEIHTTATGETTRSTTVHKTASDLVLKARSLVESSFFIPAQAAKGQMPAGTEEPPELITESGITGTWRGEPGIEMIRLRQGGQGVAFFSSGAQMSLTYTIENNYTLKIQQNSPNTERFYYPLPYGAAKQLSADAEPMRWELLLYSGGNHLKGVKTSTEANIKEDVLVELLPGTTRDALWVRSGR